MPTEQPELPIPQPLKKSISPLFEALITCQPDATQAKREQILELLIRQCIYNGFTPVPKSASDICKVLDAWNMATSINRSSQLADLLGVDIVGLASAIQTIINASDAVSSATAIPASQTKEVLADMLCEVGMKHKQIDITLPFEDNGVEIVVNPADDEPDYDNQEDDDGE